MERAVEVVCKGDAQVAAATRTVTLTREARYRRRIAMTTDCGMAFLLDLAEATYLPDGAGLLLETGEVVRVVAAAEPLIEIRATDALGLARIAWHIGNRHTPAEITASALYIQPDHVLADMVRGLGGGVREVVRPFEPEGGAYGGHGALGGEHSHGAGSAHDHRRAHDDGHGH